MKVLFIILAVIAALILLLILGVCRVSSWCSRWEEEREELQSIGKTRGGQRNRMRELIANLPEMCKEGEKADEKVL